MMVKPLLSWLLTLCVVLALISGIAQARKRGEKYGVYYSPELVMQPGSVANRFYYNIDFPRNHIGLKSFTAEVVDEAGVSVPLHNTYLHHWVINRYYQRVGTRDNTHNQSDFIPAGNSGVCSDLGQYFGLGSETRKTLTHVPDPYAIEIGNPAEIPAGYEERWMLNLHAIDTRHAVDKLGCTECRCSLYNVTIDESGKPISPDYEGGLDCCYDKTQCKVKAGFEHSPRKLYLKYTLTWFDWDASLIPVRIYIFDVTDTPRISEVSGEIVHQCEVEYAVEPCKSSDVSNARCIDTKRLSFNMPRGGYMIYGSAHMHSGGVGVTLYRKDERLICASMAMYGNGNEAGNEAGYIVGMSACYPQHGSLMIEDGENLILESNYSSSQKHTGVMGLLYILVADQLPQKNSLLDALISTIGGTELEMPVSAWIVLVLGVVAVAIFAVGFRRRNPVEDGYQHVSMGGDI